MELHLLSDQVCTETAGGTATIWLRGEVDLATVEAFRAGLCEALATGSDRLVIDLGDTTFIDCSGMGEIERVCEAAPWCEIVLRSPNNLARRLIEITELDRRCRVEL